MKYQNLSNEELFSTIEHPTTSKRRRTGVRQGGIGQWYPYGNTGCVDRDETI